MPLQTFVRTFPEKNRKGYDAEERKLDGETKSLSCDFSVRDGNIGFSVITQFQLVGITAD